MIHQILKDVLAEMLSGKSPESVAPATAINPFLGRRVLIRTYSAGVHIGELVAMDGMQAHLKNSLRLWKWSGGGLSLSAVANNGIIAGRLNRTGEIFLPNVIEIIPTTKLADETYVKFIEDEN